MIKRVVSHEWKCKGHSVLLLEIHPVEQPQATCLTLTGSAADTTPMWLSVSTSAHPWEGNDVSLAVLLLSQYRVTSTETRVSIRLEPTNRFLRLDFVGCLERGATSSSAVESSSPPERTQSLSTPLLEDTSGKRVRHQVTVTLEPAAVVTDAPTASAFRQARAKYQERRAVLSPSRTRWAAERSPSPSRRDPPPPLSPPAEDVVTTPQATVPRRKINQSPSPRTTITTTEFSAAESLAPLLTQLQALESQIRWYLDEQAIWASEKPRLLATIRGTNAMQTPRPSPPSPPASRPPASASRSPLSSGPQSEPIAG